MKHTTEEIRKTYPTGRECSEDCCMYLAPKTDAPLETSDCKPGDYECIGKAKEWPDCPRAIRAERDALRTAGDALVRVLGETFEDGEIGDKLVKMAVRGGNINGRWPRIKAALSAWRAARRPQ